MGDDDFDPERKERELLAEASSWDTTSPVDAAPGDIPIVDVGPWFATGSASDLRRAAADLRHACERVGFHFLVGHGIEHAFPEILHHAARFHALPIETKMTIEMDRPEWPLGGVGYLPVGERKLPRRTYGNTNEAFLMKGGADIAPSDNQWLAEPALPGFRVGVEAYADEIVALAKRLLPLYASALDLDSDFFEAAFRDPFWRLRLTHFDPEAAKSGPEGAHGLAPHVDTTFFTLLLQDSPGLRIYSAERGQWINAPVIEDSLVVNSGELLRQWSNDRFLSTRHFADVDGSSSRYSVPLFFNANEHYPMECLPSCHGPGNPPRYPTISYAESQAVAQGE